MDVDGAFSDADDDDEALFFRFVLSPIFFFRVRFRGEEEERSQKSPSNRETFRFLIRPSELCNKLTVKSNSVHFISISAIGLLVKKGLSESYDSYAVVRG